MVITLMGLPVLGTYLLMPKMDYLPPVKRDAVDAWFNLPAGAASQFVEQEVMSLVVERLQPYMDGEKSPALKNYYILTWPKWWHAWRKSQRSRQCEGTGKASQRRNPKRSS